ncbi:MAG TPA: hypothetical protein VEJ87_12875 [Acidimicrobiales bacterium]|nr:hypothetical protein [Acidimicrobiales bacterium]
MPDFDEVAHTISKTARDATYVLIGLGVLAFQRAQVHRQEILEEVRKQQDAVGGHLKAAQDELARLSKRIEEMDSSVEAILDRIDSALEPIEDKLPDRTRELVQQAHDQAKSVRRQTQTVRRQIRSFITPAA